MGASSRTSGWSWECRSSRRVYHDRQTKPEDFSQSKGKARRLGEEPGGYLSLKAARILAAEKGRMRLLELLARYRLCRQMGVILIISRTYAGINNNGAE
jgi:hypothetical protein